MKSQINFGNLGGGEPNYTDVVNFAETLINGDKTITVSALSSIKAVFYRYTTRPQQFYGWAVLDNGTYDIYNASNIGITSVSGNEVTLHWNGADVLDFFVLGQA